MSTTREALHHALTHCPGTVCLVSHSILLSLLTAVTRSV